MADDFSGEAEIVVAPGVGRSVHVWLPVLVSIGYRGDMIRVLMSQGRTEGQQVGETTAVPVSHNLFLDNGGRAIYLTSKQMAWQSIGGSMAPLDEHVCFLLDVATRRITRFYNRRLRQFGITYNHLFILTCLWEQDGVHVKELAKQLYLDSSSLTGHLDRMERVALVVRQDDPDDRRAVRVFLTAKGRRLQVQLEPISQELKEALQRGVPPERVAALRAALQNMSRKLG
jgi:MarR family transcriptional regulator, organic hydroperoxide resistance regulator